MISNIKMKLIVEEQLAILKDLIDYKLPNNELKDQYLLTYVKALKLYNNKNYEDTGKILGIEWDDYININPLLVNINSDILYFINDVKLDKENNLFYINIKDEGKDIRHIIEKGFIDVYGYDYSYIFKI